MGQVLSGGSSVLTGFLEKDAADRAYATQKKGISVQQKLLKDEFNPDRINALVSKYDRGFLQKRLDLQKEFDPELYELRQRGKQNLLNELGRDNASRQSQQVANALYNENIKPDEAQERLKDQLFAQANEEIKAGASLPPELQAELVRAGVSGAAGSGFALDKRAIGGPIAHAIGSEAIALKQQRQGNAIRLGQAAQGLQDARARILQGIFPTVQTAENTAESRSAAAFAIGNENLPSGGLTGREAAGFDIQGKEGARTLTGQRFDLKAQKTLRDAAIMNNMIGQVGSFGGLLYQPQQYDTNTGGPVASGGGGGGGGGGGMLGGLMGGGGGGGGLNLSSIVGLAGLLCDVNLKDVVEAVRPEDILAKVRKLPVTRWKYVNPSLGPGEHIAPMAQDFHKAFGLGDDSRKIGIGDLLGVVLVSLQALAAKVEQLEGKR